MANPRTYFTLGKASEITVIWNGKVVSKETLPASATEYEYRLAGKIPEGEAGLAEILLNGKRIGYLKLAAGWQLDPPPSPVDGENGCCGS